MTKVFWSAVVVVVYTGLYIWFVRECWRSACEVVTRAANSQPRGEK